MTLPLPAVCEERRTAARWRCRSTTGNSAAPAMRALASACTMRATAAATSKLEVSDSSIRSVSSLERKPRHQTTEGSAASVLARAGADRPAEVDGGRNDFVRQKQPAERQASARITPVAARRGTRPAISRTLRHRPTHTDHSNAERRGHPRRERAAGKRLPTLAGRPIEIATRPAQYCGGVVDMSRGGGTLTVTPPTMLPICQPASGLAGAQFYFGL